MNYKKEARDLVIEFFDIIDEPLVDKFYGVTRLDEWAQAKDLALVCVDKMMGLCFTKEHIQGLGDLGQFCIDERYKLEEWRKVNDEIKKL